jgi:putative transposase
MAQELSQRAGYPVELACEVLELPRSTYYYHQQFRDEHAVVGAMQTIAGQFPTYGRRRMSHELRRNPYWLAVNPKRVERLMRQEGLLQAHKHTKIRTTNSQHPYPRYENLVKELTIDHPDQVWVCDITYIRLDSGFVYLAIVMDVFTRVVRGWDLGPVMDSALCLNALGRALEAHTPEIHHSDQGIQYAANPYVHRLNSYHIRISMAAVGKAEENGYAERLMRTIKEEEVDLSIYQNVADARNQIGHFLEDVYNHKRIHSSLGYLTPAEFELAYRLAQTQPGQTTPNKP